jgi:hypothetical protein
MKGHTMVDPEELYYKLVQFVSDLGLELNDNADDSLAHAANDIADYNRDANL